MQAANTIKLIKNNVEMGKKFPKEVIPYLLKAVENADYKLKCDIENQIVNIGEVGIPVLINSLETTSGVTRGLVAMSLIRLGEISLEYLKSVNTESNWVVDYVINEIVGSGRSVKFTSNNLNEVLVG